MGKYCCWKVPTLYDAQGDPRFLFSSQKEGVLFLRHCRLPLVGLILRVDLEVRKSPRAVRFGFFDVFSWSSTTQKTEFCVVYV